MQALIVVAKRPVPGQTKTRLTPPLTSEQAAGLYEALLRDTLELVRCVPGVRLIIAYLPDDAHVYFRALAPDFDLMPQRGPDLGARLDNALTHCLNDGCERAVIMDSDSPTLPAKYLVQAFGELESFDSVLGPCDDGGYYLIGLRRPAPRLLRDVQMSTPNVTRDTLALAASENLSMAQLPEWYDVDTAADLERLRADVSALPAGRAEHTRRFFGLKNSPTASLETPLDPQTPVC
jgi:rSAM/selenodomain-associated transferase 1